MLRRPSSRLAHVRAVCAVCCATASISACGRVLYRPGDASNAPDTFELDAAPIDASSLGPDAFAPDAFASDVFAPDAFAPDAAFCASIETAGELAVFPDHDPIGVGPFTFETWLRTSVPGVTVVAANRTGTGPGTYRGGADVALTFPSSPRDLPMATSVVLGRDSASGGSDFPGRLRMLRVWRVARTVEEVRASWSSSVGAHPDLLFEAMLDGVALGGTISADVRRGGVLKREIAATTRLAVPDCP